MYNKNNKVSCQTKKVIQIYKIITKYYKYKKNVNYYLRFIKTILNDD